MSEREDPIAKRLNYFLAVPPVFMMIALLMVVVVVVGGSIEFIRQFAIIGMVANSIILFIGFTAPAWTIMFIFALYKDIKSIQQLDIEWQPSLWKWLLGGLILSPLVGFGYLLLRQAHVGTLFGEYVAEKVYIE